MYKKRAKNQANDNIMPKIRQMAEKLDEETKNKLHLLLEEFLAQRQQNLEEFESVEKEIELKVKQHYANLMSTIPPNVQDMTIGDLRAAGGSLEVRNCAYCFLLSPNLLQNELAMSAKKPESSRAILEKLNNTAKKSLKRRSERNTNILSPGFASAKKKVAKIASRPSAQFSIAHGMSQAPKRNLRSSVRFGKIAQPLFQNDKHECQHSKTPKQMPKRPRKPLNSEEIVIMSKNGTPLVVDSEFLLKRFNLE
ncbi:hypothetical protein HDE_11929 [Halotydeus destructor]|nr:hypothetical protein HDE_11929 [Halotydeus destructor]